MKGCSFLRLHRGGGGLPPRSYSADGVDAENQARTRVQASSQRVLYQEVIAFYFYRLRIPCRIDLRRPWPGCESEAYRSNHVHSPKRRTARQKRSCRSRNRHLESSELGPPSPRAPCTRNGRSVECPRCIQYTNIQSTCDSRQSPMASENEDSVPSRKEDTSQPCLSQLRSRRSGLPRRSS